MKYLIQAIVFAVCYCLDGYLKPFFPDLGYVIGIWISGDPDIGAIIAGLIGGLQVALVYGSGFAVAKRINERRLDGSLRTAPGIKRTAFGLLALILDDILRWSGILGLAALAWGLVAFCRRKPAAPRPAPSKFTEEADSAPVPVQPPATPSPKPRFCKLCAEPIDPVPRKCTGSKKQYFRLPTFTDKHWFIAALAVACAVILFLLFTLSAKSNQVAELAATVADLESKLAAAEQDASYQKQKVETNKSQLDGLRRANEELRDKVSDMEEKVQFFDRHAVFVLDDGSKEYHTYDCAWRKYSGLSFWIYNTEAAESKGYKPHFCCD